MVQAVQAAWIGVAFQSMLLLETGCHHAVAARGNSMTKPAYLGKSVHWQDALVARWHKKVQRQFAVPGSLPRVKQKAARDSSRQFPRRLLALLR